MAHATPSEIVTRLMLLLTDTPEITSAFHSFPTGGIGHDDLTCAILNIRSVQTAQMGMRAQTIQTETEIDIWIIPKVLTPEAALLTGAQESELMSYVPVIAQLFYSNPTLERGGDGGIVQHARVNRFQPKRVSPADNRNEGNYSALQCTTSILTYQDLTA